MWFAGSREDFHELGFIVRREVDMRHARKVERARARNSSYEYRCKIWDLYLLAAEGELGYAQRTYNLAHPC
jgi:hypothetical protein